MAKLTLIENRGPTLDNHCTQLRGKQKISILSPLPDTKIFPLSAVKHGDYAGPSKERKRVEFNKVKLLIPNQRVLGSRGHILSVLYTLIHHHHRQPRSEEKFSK